MENCAHCNWGLTTLSKEVNVRFIALFSLFDRAQGRVCGGQAGRLTWNVASIQKNGQYWTIWARDKWTIKLWHRNFNIISGQPWWHIVFLRTLIPELLRPRMSKCCDYTKRKILKKGKYWTFWVRDEIKSLSETCIKNDPKGDLKAYRGIGVSMLGAPFQPEK